MPRRRDDGFKNGVPPRCRYSSVIVEDSPLLALQKSGWILLGNRQEP